MNAEQLNAIKERAEKAIPGPWYTGEGYEQMFPGYYVASESNGLIVLAEEEGILRKDDVEFIAHARQDIPELIAEVERLQAEIQRVDSLYAKKYTLCTHYKNIAYEQSKEIERLRKALEYYADNKHYEPYGPSDSVVCDVTEDEGYIAREALNND